jgi:hypothetical protein
MIRFAHSIPPTCVLARQKEKAMPRKQTGVYISGRASKALGIICFWAGLLLAGIQTENSPAWADSPDKFQEYQVKAAFLYNFGKFVEWPPRAFPERNSPLIIAVLGKDPFGEVLDPLNRKMVGTREIKIMRFSGLDRLETAHILFINLPEPEQTQKALKMVASWNVLTVSDAKGFTHAGGGIRFYIEEDKIRFEINPDALQRHGLKASSQLLKLAKIVKDP